MMFQAMLMIFGLMISTGIPITQDDVKSDSVHGKGILESSESIELRNRTGMEVAIIDLAPEGTMVRKGDRIAQLDDAELRDKLAQQSIIIANVKAELIQAEAANELLKREIDSANEMAKLRIDLAALHRQRTLGELEVELREVDNAIKLAQQELQLATTTLQSLKDSADSTASQKHKLTLQITNAKATIESAQARKKLLEGPEREFRVAQHKLEMREAELERSRAKNKGDIELAQVNAKLKAVRERFELEREKLEELKRQLESCRISAPQEGKVVYAHVRGRRGIDFYIEPGAMVRDRQAIVTLPNMDRLQVRVAVKEKDIRRIKVGQAATIRIDAFPDRVFEGKVVHKKPYPEPSGWQGGDTRHYSVAISVGDPPGNLKLGMTAEVEIKTSR